VRSGRDFNDHVRRLIRGIKHLVRQEKARRAEETQKRQEQGEERARQDPAPLQQEDEGTDPLTSRTQRETPNFGDLADHVQRSTHRIRQVHADARQKVEREHDYAGAARLLEEIPESFRDASLYATVCEKRDRAALLEQDIGAAVQAMRLEGLR